jgi:hypothetical protein
MLLVISSNNSFHPCAAEVDNTNGGLDNSRYHTATEFNINNCFIIYSKARKKEKPFCLRFQTMVTTASNNTFLGPKKYCTLMASAAEITRRLEDTENYPTRFDQPRTRIDFEYIIIIFICS